MMLNLLFAFFNDVGLMGITSPTENWDLEAEYNNQSWLASLVSDALNVFGLGDVAKSINLFQSFLGRTLFFIPNLMRNSGLSNSLINIVEGAHWFIYIVGFLQLVRGVMWEGFD